MKTICFDGIFLFALLCLLLGWYLFRPLRHHPQPAPFACLGPADGTFKTIPFKPKTIFGIGLSYAQHIAETAHEFDPAGFPAVFFKDRRSLLPGGGVTDVPETAELIAAAGSIDQNLPAQLRKNFPDLPPLLDYEAELGFMLLENITAAQLANHGFNPKVGFLVANDLSARSLQILGEGMPNRLGYWSMSKSLENFLPVSEKIWIPKRNSADAIPCVTLETRVNGVLRQSARTDNMIYTPRQMLQAALKTYPGVRLKKGDIVIMGTPGGIALSTPRFKARLAELFHLDRLTRLKFVLKTKQGRFLKAGDRVVVSGGWLGEVRSELR